jgi:hypothetical protein
MDIITFLVIAVAIGLFVVIAIVRLRRLDPSSPPHLQEALAYRAKSFDEIIKQDLKLGDFVREAQREGASHIASDGTITVYRQRDSNHERRSLEFSPSGKWFWLTSWQKCNELPEYALTIPETF